MMARAKRLLYRSRWAIYALALLLVAFNAGIKRIYNVDFVPTNGDFQTYNLLRRFLDGQAPYAGYANYLGMGGIVLLAPLLALHNSFAGSLFVSEFMAMLCFAAIVALVLYLVCGRAYLSAVSGLLFVWLVRGGFVAWLPVVGGYWQNVFSLLAQPGNSLRVLRMLWPFLFAFLLLAAAKLYTRRTGRVPNPYRAVQSRRLCAGVGLLAGAGIVWSNDFGFATLGACTVLLAALWLAGRPFSPRRTGLAALCYLGGAAGGGLLAVTLATRGRPGAWLSYTRGVAGWQNWYYGVRPSEKLHSVAELLASGWQLWAALAFIVAVCALGLVKIARRTAGLRLLLYGCISLAVFAAYLVYLVGSGYNGFYEGIMALMALSLLGLALHGVLRLFAARGLMLAPRAVLALGLALYIALQGVDDIRRLRGYVDADFPARPEYAAGLEGVTYLAEPIAAQAEIVGDASLFALYASALDASRGSFQPTGVDYIIHALGGEERAAYIAQFKAGEFAYVQTLSSAYGWEPWILRANWDLYRELLAGYRPVSASFPWALWQRVEQPEALLAENVQAEVQLTQIDEQTWEVQVQAGGLQQGIVEVQLAYTSGKGRGLAALQVWTHSVAVRDESIDAAVGYDSYTLPTGAEARLVPVVVQDGRGSITLTTLPAQHTWLRVESAAAGNVYAVALEY